MAPTQDGSRARKRAALSPGSVRRRPRGRRGPSGRGAAAGEGCARWSGAGEGGVPRCPGEPEYVDGRQISAELLSVLGIPVLRGRAFRPEEDRPGAPAVAIISYGLWQRRYGGESGAIGRPLVFEGKPYTIVGIAPERFELAGAVDVCTPLGQNPESRMQNREA